MEVAIECFKQDLELYVARVPRDQDQEADRLANGNFSDVSSTNRIQLDINEMRFGVLRELIAEGEVLYLDIEARKKRAARHNANANSHEQPTTTGRPGKRKRLKATRLKSTHPW